MQLSKEVIHDACGYHRQIMPNFILCDDTITSLWEYYSHSISGPQQTFDNLPCDILLHGIAKYG